MVVDQHSNEDITMTRHRALYTTRYSRTWEMVEPDIHLVDFVGTLKNEKALLVLDVACGGGRNSFFLAGKGFHLIGLDISQVALKLASERARSEKTQCTFVLGTFLNLPFRNGNFDAAISTYGIENVSLQEVGRALSEMKRVTKKGGVLFVTLHSEKHWRFGQGKEIDHHEYLTFSKTRNRKIKVVTHFFDREEAKRLFRHVGLKLLSIKETVRTDDKQRAHWIATLENQS